MSVQHMHLLLANNLNDTLQSFQGTPLLSDVPCLTSLRLMSLAVHEAKGLERHGGVRV